MMSFTFDEQDHRDFDPDSIEHSQKLKGVIDFSTSIEMPEPSPLEVTPKMKKQFIYKVKEKIEDIKDATRKLF